MNNIEINAEVKKLFSGLFKESFEDIKQEIKSAYSGRSPNVDLLTAALSKAQSEMDIVERSSNNPFFKSKYADLASLIKHSRIPLTKNNLAVMQQILHNPEDQYSYLHSILSHSSGQWIQSTIRIIPAKGDIQAYGSALTYLRRYAYAALICIVGGEDDDDGEQAMVEVRKETKPKPDVKPISKNPIEELITKEQLDILDEDLTGEPEITLDILEGFAITKLSMMPKKYFQASRKRIQEIKAAKGK